MPQIIFKKFIDNYFDGFFELDLNGKILYYNKKFSLNFGYDRNELINTPFFNIVNKSIKIEMNKFLKKLDRKQTNSEIIFGELINKKNGKEEIELILNLNFKKNSEITILTGIFKLEKSIQIYDTMNLKNQLEYEKYKNSQILSSISHELRTPLNAIIGFSDLMLETQNDNTIEDLKDYIEDIKESGKYLLKLVNNVLNISKLESKRISAKLEPIFLLNFIKNVKSLMESDIKKKGLKFEIINVQDSNVIQFDAKMFNEILKNLISNAIKFTDKGKISIIYEETEDNWFLSIKDTGIGIKEENIENIFIEFSKINNAMIAVSEGHGLGLALTKKLVILHNGEISVKSKLNQGTTFILEFPKKPK